MFKALWLVLGTIPISIFMPMPAEANNGQCCISSRGATRPPQTPACVDMTSFPTDAECTLSRNTTDFCAAPSATARRSPIFWDYQIVNGVCTLVGRTMLQQINIRECDRNKETICQ